MQNFSKDIMDLHLRLYGKQDMSHSSGTSFNSGRQGKNQLLTPLGDDTKNNLSVGKMGNASNISRPQKGFPNIESRSASLTLGSRNYSQPSSQGYLMSHLSQPSGRGFVSNCDKQTTDVQLLRSRLARNFNNNFNALSISRGNFPSLHPTRPMWAETSHSTISQIQPQGLILRECINEGGQSSVPSIQAFRKNSDTDLRILKQGCGDYQSNSTLLLGQDKKDICSTFKSSVISLSRKDDGSFLMLNNVSPKHNHSQACYQDLHQGIQNLSQIGLLPSWSSSSKLKMLDQQHRFQTRLHSAHDVRTMKTFTPVNSVIRASEVPHMISETTRSLPNGERVDSSFCKENRLSEKFEALDLNKDSYQAFGHGQQGVKLQCLDSSTHSGGIESVQCPSAFLFVSKNELSAETGTHDTDIKENHLSGARPFTVNKNVRTYVKLSSTDASVFPVELWSKPVIPVIPDLNIALPESPGADTLMRHLDASTQRKKRSYRSSVHAMEPTIKTRKKHKTSDILDSGDSTQQEIVNKSFRKTGKGKRTQSELTFAGKEVIVLDLDVDADDGPSLLTSGGSSSKELIEVEKETNSDKNGKTPSGLKLCNK